MKKLATIFLSLFGALTLFAGVASAHVTVQPKETTQGTYEVFTVRVPSENESVTTTKVEVKIPAEVDISRFEPKADWDYELQKDETGKITGVTWTTTGEGLSPTEFIQFNMQGKVADDATELVWKAYQTYGDGSVVEWVGAEGSDKPASVTLVNKKVVDDNDQNNDVAQEEDDNTTSSVPLYLSIAALVLGLIALINSFRKRG